MGAPLGGWVVKGGRGGIGGRGDNVDKCGKGRPGKVKG